MASAESSSPPTSPAVDERQVSGWDFLRQLHVHLQRGTGKLVLTPSGVEFLRRQYASVLSAEREGRDPPDLKSVRATDLHHIMSVLRSLPHLSIEATPLPPDARLDLTPFGRLRVLELHRCGLTSVHGLSRLRPTLERLTLSSFVGTGTVDGKDASESADIVGVSLREALAQCFADYSEEGDWACLESLVVRRCGVRRIDAVMQLLPVVEEVNLAKNRIADVENLQFCSRMRYLNLAQNDIRDVSAINRVLGNVTTLILRNNKISSLGAIPKLYALEKLDLSFNLIASTGECQELERLPCLEQLWLRGNPVAFVDGYRVRMLALFQPRGEDGRVLLDGREASARELAAADALIKSQFAKGERPQTTIRHSRTATTAIESSAAAASTRTDPMMRPPGDHRRSLTMPSSWSTPPRRRARPRVAEIESSASKDAKRKRKKKKKKKKKKKGVEADSEDEGKSQPQHEKNDEEEEEEDEEEDDSQVQERLGVADFAQQLESLQEEGGSRWLTMLHELEVDDDSLLNGSSSTGSNGTDESARRRKKKHHKRKKHHKKKKKRKKKRRHGDDEDDDEGSGDGGNVSTHHDERAGPDADDSASVAATEDSKEDGSEAALAAPVAEPPSVATVEELLNSYECLATVSPEAGSEDKESIVLSINESTVRELSLETGAVLRSRALSALSSVKINMADSALTTMWAGDGLGEWTQCVYVLPDAETLMELVELFADKMVGEEEEDEEDDEDEKEEEQQSNERKASSTGHQPQAESDATTNNNSSSAQQTPSATPQHLSPAPSPGIQILDEYCDDPNAVRSTPATPLRRSSSRKDGSRTPLTSAGSTARERNAAIVERDLDQFYTQLTTGHPSTSYRMHARVSALFIPSDSADAKMPGLVRRVSGLDDGSSDRDDSSALNDAVHEGGGDNNDDDDNATGSISDGPSDASFRSPRAASRTGEQSAFLLLTRTHLLVVEAAAPVRLLNTTSPGKQLNKRKPSRGFRLLFQRAIQSVSRVWLGLSLQYLHAEFERSSNKADGVSVCVLLTRDRTVTHEIVQELVAARKTFSLSLDIESDDADTIHRIQGEAFGGANVNIRMYACVFRVPAIPVTLVVTDDMAVLIKEDFHEMTGKRSRYVVIAIEQLSDLSNFTVKSMPRLAGDDAPDDVPGRFVMAFGEPARAFRSKRHEGRAWELVSHSPVTINKLKKMVRTSMGV